MIVSKIKKFLFQVIIISLIISCMMNYQETTYFIKAAEVIMDGTGCLIPINDTTLQMVETNVMFYIDETFGKKGQFRIVFDGNYTIYNPFDTIEKMVGAPFVSVYEDILDLFKLEIDDTEVEFALVSFYEHNFNFTHWEDYFSYYDYLRSFALSNITFVGFSPNGRGPSSFPSITVWLPSIHSLPRRTTLMALCNGSHSTLSISTGI